MLLVAECRGVRCLWETYFIMRKASPLRLRHSQSLASLRHRLSQAKAHGDPPSGQDGKSLCVTGLLDDLAVATREDFL
jgi:hypothetical protein